MKRWVLILVLVLVAGIGLLVAAGFIARSVVRGSGKPKLEAALAQATGVRVSIAAADLDLAQFFRGRPAASLDGVVLGNPPGFQRPNLLEARRMSAQVSLWPLLRREIQVNSIEVREPKVYVERNPQDITNLEVFVKGLPSREEEKAEAAAKLSIDELRIIAGEAVIYDAGEVHIRDVDVTLSDLAPGRSAKLQVDARLFGGRDSKLELEAAAGPFKADAFPLNGKLSMTIAPDEIPAGVRREHFGDLLAAPGRESRVHVEAAVNGDVYTSLSGPAKVKLSDVLVGRDDKHVLPLAGEAPLEFAANRLMTAPVFDVRVPTSTLRIGKGEWTGSAEAQVRGSLITGTSTGSIQKLDIDELLTTFTSAGGKIYGALAVPSYTIKFSGRNADQVRESLDGSGKLALTEGRLAAFDFLHSIQKALEANKPDSTKGATPFSTCSAEFVIRGSKVEVSTLLLDSPLLQIVGKGTIGFDQTMKFDLNTRVTGGTARLVNKLARREQTDEAGLPVVVAGKVDAPQVRPNVGRLATGAVRGWLDKVFNRKKQ
jgi:uncharacterized protein involved in outer membrane biogenesis